MNLQPSFTNVQNADTVGEVMDRYEYKQIKEIDPQTPKICLVGKVKKRLEDSLIIEDEGAEVELKGQPEIEEGEFIRVFCSRENDHFKIDFFQKITEEELNLFKRFLSLYKMVEEYV